MCSFQVFPCVDPSLGRVGYSSFSDQTLMEMLIEDFDDESKSKYKDNDGMYLDVCEWLGVRCDADGRVVQILINSNNVTGSLELRYVPPKVKVLRLICLVATRLTGSADLTQLPEGMQTLSLSKNRFTGEIDLTQLPEGMYSMYLNNNQLTGEIDLAHLPCRMTYLSLHHNQLTGEIDLTHLPETMKQLHLQKNQLTGSLVIKKLPQETNLVDVRRNHFNDIAVVESKTHATIKLRRSGVMSVVDENGDKHIRFW